MLSTFHFRVPTSHFLRGFTLIEVMVALGIFAIGFIAVAAIFPTAILLQKNTLNEDQANHFIDNTEALLRARGIDEADLPGVGEAVVEPLPPAALAQWSLADRSYPSTTLLAGRTLFWVPLIYDSDPDPGNRDWKVFVFIVRSQTGVTYAWAAGDANPSSDDGVVPSVRKVTVSGATWPVPAGVQPGNQVLVDGVPTVVEADTDVPLPGGTVDVWYADPGSNGSPRPPSAYVALKTLVDVSNDLIHN